MHTGQFGFTGFINIPWLFAYFGAFAITSLYTIVMCSGLVSEAGFGTVTKG